MSIIMIFLINTIVTLLSLKYLYKSYRIDNNAIGNYSDDIRVRDKAIILITFLTIINIISYIFGFNTIDGLVNFLDSLDIADNYIVNIIQSGIVITTQIMLRIKLAITFIFGEITAINIAILYYNRKHIKAGYKIPKLSKILAIMLTVIHIILTLILGILVF